MLKSTVCASSKILSAYEDQQGRLRESLEESGVLDGEKQEEVREDKTKAGGFGVVKEIWLKGLLAFERAKSEGLQDKLENLIRQNTEAVREKDGVIEGLQNKIARTIQEYEQAIESLRRGRLEMPDPPPKLEVKIPQTGKKLSFVVKDQINKNRIKVLEKLAEDREQRCIEIEQELAAMQKIHADEISNLEEVLETSDGKLSEAISRLTSAGIKWDADEKQASALTSIKKKYSACQAELEKTKTENTFLLHKIADLTQPDNTPTEINTDLFLDPQPLPLLSPQEWSFSVPVTPQHLEPESPRSPQSPQLPPSLPEEDDKPVLHSIGVMTDLVEVEHPVHPDSPRVADVAKKVEAEKTRVMKTVKKKEATLTAPQKEEIVTTLHAEAALAEEEAAVQKVIRLVRRVREETRSIKVPDGCVIERMERMVAEMGERWQDRREELLNERRKQLTKVLAVMGLVSDHSNFDWTPSLVPTHSTDRCTCTCSCKKCRGGEVVSPPALLHDGLGMSAPQPKVAKPATKAESQRPAPFTLFSPDSAFIKSSTVALVEPRVTTLRHKKPFKQSPSTPLLNITSTPPNPASLLPSLGKNHRMRGP